MLYEVITDADELKDKKKALEKATGKKVFTISGVAGLGMDDLLYTLKDLVKERKKQDKEETKVEEVKTWTP